jgi:predicted secreted hydrolase
MTLHGCSGVMLRATKRRGCSAGMLQALKLRGCSGGVTRVMLLGRTRMAALSGVLCMALSACAPSDDVAVAASSTLRLEELLGGTDTLHERAIEPRTFRFPADHGPHPEFRTEWWYFTGNVTATDGRELAYHLTFFRSALLDSASFAAGAVDTARERSAWRTRHAYMAHFAVSDITGRRFEAAQRFGRAALDLAGARAQPFRVWIDDWHAAATRPDHDADMFPIRLRAAESDVVIDLTLEAGKPPVLQGDRGLSRKGPEQGNASYYYSHTRMPTRGTMSVGGRTYEVAGSSWLDREWSTGSLSPDLQGWDWMALQLADSTELMLYRLRRHDGTASPFSAATHIDAAGTATALAADAFAMTPLRTWPSDIDGTAYPVAWRVHVPAFDLQLDIEAAFDAQELNLAVRYWEGAVRIRGTRQGRSVTGRGFLEMTGL